MLLTSAACKPQTVYGASLPAKAAPEPPTVYVNEWSNFAPKRVLQQFTRTGEVILLPNAAAKPAAVY